MEDEEEKWQSAVESVGAKGEKGRQAERSMTRTIANQHCSSSWRKIRMGSLLKAQKFVFSSNNSVCDFYDKRSFLMSFYQTCKDSARTGEKCR